MIELEKFLLKLLMPIILVSTVVSTMILFYYLEWTESKWSYITCLLIVIPTLIIVAAYILNNLQNGIQKLDEEERLSSVMTDEEQLSVLMKLAKMIKESKVKL